MSKNELKIQVLKLADSTSGKPVVMGTVRMEDFAGIYDVDQYDPQSQGDIGDEGEGYQRSEEPKRVALYVNNLVTNQTDSNTSIICNIRNFKDTELIDENGNYYLIFDKKDIVLHVSEGQHRSAGYKSIMDDLELKDAFKDIPIPVIFYLGEDIDHEKLTFFNTNFYQKSVPINNKQELQIGILNVKESEVKSVELMKLIRNDSKVWEGKLIKPNSKIGILPSSGFTTSIKQHLATQAWFEMLEVTTIYTFLNAFWEAVKTTLPECFEEPEKFALQKAVGVNVMHSILPIIYQKIRDNGEKPDDPATWEKYLGYLKKHKSDNRETPPTPANGYKFWLTGKSGGAGRYSSAAGKAELIGIFKDAVK